MAPTVQLPKVAPPPALSLAVRRGLVAGPDTVERLTDIKSMAGAATLWASDSMQSLSINDDAWALRTTRGHVLRTFRRDEQDNVVGVSNDARRVFLRESGRSMGRLACLDLSTGLRSHVQDSNTTTALARGAMMAACLDSFGAKHRIKLYSQELDELRVFEAPQAHRVWLSPDGQFVIYADWSGRAHCIDTHAGTDKALGADKETHMELAFAGAAPRALLVSKGCYCVLDLKTQGAVYKSAPVQRAGCHLPFAISPRGERVAIPVGNVYAIVKVENGAEKLLPFSVANAVAELLFTPDGDVLLARLVCSDGFHVEAFSVHTGTRLWRHTHSDKDDSFQLSQLSLSPDGSRLNVGSRSLLFGHKPRDLFAKPSAEQKLTVISPVATQLRSPGCVFCCERQGARRSADMALPVSRRGRPRRGGGAATWRRVAHGDLPSELRGQPGQLDKAGAAPRMRQGAAPGGRAADRW